MRNAKSALPMLVATLIFLQAIAIRPAIAEAADDSYISALSRIVRSNWDDSYFAVMTMQVDNPMLSVDGKEREIDPGRGTTPVIKQDRTLLPIRSVIEATGGTVLWDEKAQMVTIIDTDTVLQMVIGSRTIQVNGVSSSIDVAPDIINDRTMLPIRAVAENLGFDVGWIDTTRMAVLTKPYQTKRILAMLKSGASYDFSSLGAEVINEPGKPVALQFKSQDAAKNGEAALLASGKFSFVVPDSVTVPASLEVSPVTGSWGYDRLAGNEYAQALLGQGRNPEVIVAVVDSGISSNHSIFQGRRASGGYDFINGDDDPADDHGHGTHVAGTVIDNTPGMNVSILPMKVMGQDGKGTVGIVCAGIERAVELGADVINLSLATTQNAYLDDVVKKAVAAGSIVVTAAGNSGMPAEMMSPSGVSQAIVAAATDSNDMPYIKSNYGSYVDVAAPGVGISSAALNGGTVVMTGTSMSAAHVSAAAALLRSENKGITPGQAEISLKAKTGYNGPGKWDTKYGTGVVSFIGATPPPSLTPTPMASEYKWSVDQISLELNETATFKLLAVFEDGTEKDATSTSKMQSSDDSIVKLLENGKVEAVSKGEAFIWLEIPSVQNIKTPGPLKVIVGGEDEIVEYKWSVDKAELDLGLNKTFEFKLLAVYASGKEEDATDTSEMSVDDESIAKLEKNGKLTAIAFGETFVWLGYPSVNTSIKLPAPLKVTVANDAIVSFIWENSTPRSITVGETIHIGVLAVHASGSITDATELVMIQADAGIVSVEGLDITGVSPGFAELSLLKIPDDQINLPHPLAVEVTSTENP
ncbi:MAG: S8 family serine peptidase [Clostridiales bacterium]|jgi:subtilisin family serine protease|nr:S8 family serine peptidase [Clostridiales bacterium]